MVHAVHKLRPFPFFYCFFLFNVACQICRILCSFCHSYCSMQQRRSQGYIYTTLYHSSAISYHLSLPFFFYFHSPTSLFQFPHSFLQLFFPSLHLLQYTIAVSNLFIVLSNIIVGSTHLHYSVSLCLFHLSFLLINSVFLHPSLPLPGTNCTHSLFSCLCFIFYLAA